jgi:hypothetical protein
MPETNLRILPVPNITRRTCIDAILFAKMLTRRLDSEIKQAGMIIRLMDRRLKKTGDDPFAKHRRREMKSVLKKAEAFLDDRRKRAEPIRENLLDAILAYDILCEETGFFDVHEMAALLSTSADHVDAPLFFACWRHMIETIKSNPELDRIAMNVLQELALKNTGRPLVAYQMVTMPNGEEKLVPAKPDLQVVH